MDTKERLKILLETPPVEALRRGVRVTIGGQEGEITAPPITGRYGKFDPRREVAVRIGRRVKVVRKGDVVVST